jgi:hypothetical protein
MSDLQSFQTKLQSATSILIALPQNAPKDTVAAALALYLSLKGSGKSASIVSSTQPVVRDSYLVGLDKIETGVGGQNLVITINLPEDAVDKVTSNVEGGHLNLVLQPKPGNPPITGDNLVFGSSGAAADLIITVGAGSLTDMGAISEKEHELFTKDKIINLSNKPGNFGSINLTDPSASCSELVTALLQELKLPLSQDIAGNLMQGIQVATNNLTASNMTADTFEALAVLYRAGARRTSPAEASAKAGPAKIVNNLPIQDVETKGAKPPEIKPAPDQPKSEAEPDWLKPKIFKGGSPSTK